MVVTVMPFIILITDAVPGQLIANPIDRTSTQVLFALRDLCSLDVIFECFSWSVLVLRHYQGGHNSLIGRATKRVDNHELRIERCGSY